jgi:hypothetical protein
MNLNLHTAGLKPFLYSKIFALIFFLSVWALAVFSLYKGYESLVYPIVILGLIYEVFTTSSPLKVFLLISILGFLGWLLESCEAYFGTVVMFNYTTFAPLWLGLLWALFMSSTLRTMPFVFKNIWFCFVFGCYSLPGTYFFISKLGIAHIKEPLWISLTINSLISGFIFLITFYLLKIYFYKNGDLYVSNSK